MTNATLEYRPNAASPEVIAANTDESGISQFVTFIVGEEVFAVDMSPVQEIIRVPDVVRVPLAPPTLDGLANLRGKVLPIISLRRIFGFEEREYDDSTRAVVIDQGQPLGFVVDRVSSVVGVEAEQIEGVGSMAGTVDTDLLNGLLKDVGGHKMIMVMDFARLIAKEFAEVTALAQANGREGLGVGQNHRQGINEVSNDELQLVSFEVVGQEYAIAIEDVQEIVQMPETIVQIPHAAAHVLGIMTLRNRLLPLVSLRRIFGLPPHEADEQSRIVVVSLGNASVGVVMDSVNEVLRVPKANVEVMPGLLARDGDFSDITDICRLEGGRRLVSIISAKNMFQHSSIKEVLNTVDDLNSDNIGLDTVNNDADVSVEDEEQVVIFRLDKEEYGVPIDSVQEIVRVPEELTHVPKAPLFVKGVINLRGSVLPVIDQRQRLGLAMAERNDRQRIMVFLLNGVRTGFIVDSVTEVLKIPKKAIEASPRLSSEQAKLLGRVANLEKQKRLIQLIEPSQLLENLNLKLLSNLEH